MHDISVELMALVFEQEVPVLVLLLLNTDMVLVSPESDASPERELRTLIVCMLGCWVSPTPESYPVATAPFGPNLNEGYFDESCALVLIFPTDPARTARRITGLSPRDGTPCSIRCASKEQAYLISDSSSREIYWRLIKCD